MDKTKKRSRKNFLVESKNESDVITKLEKIHKGEKVVTIHEIIWDEEQIKESEKIQQEIQKNTISGEVKFFNSEKGYGYIQRDDGLDDLFFHVTAVISEEIYDYERVEFEVSEGPKGLCAIHVTVMDE